MCFFGGTRDWVPEFGAAITNLSDFTGALASAVSQGYPPPNLYLVLIDAPGAWLEFPSCIQISSDANNTTPDMMRLVRRWNKLYLPK